VSIFLFFLFCDKNVVCNILYSKSIVIPNLYNFLIAQHCSEKMSILVYVLVMMFGSSTWLCVTGVWVELPLMVSVYPLPEGWSLPSYLSVAIQLAALGPVLHWLCEKLFPRTFAHSSRLQIYVFMTFGERLDCFCVLNQVFIF